VAAWDPPDDFRTELDRVGVSYRRAGAADYVKAVDLGDSLWLLGLPRLRPRPRCEGSLDGARAVVAEFADGAGPELFWEAFGG